MSVYSGTNHITKALCITIVLGAMASFIDLTSAGQETRVSPKLTFTENEDGGYEFDTGILRGRLREAGKSLGLSSTVHVPTGTTLNGAYGILSYYRVFTTNKRYGTAAWSWPGTSKLLPDGAVQVTWPEGDDRPFEMTAIYRFRNGSTLDVETIVKAGKDLGKFEVFLASYFHKAFPLTKVFVTPDPKIVGKRTFLTAKKSFGNWQMFPRNNEVVSIIRDGRWKLHVARREKPLETPELYDLEADPTESTSLTKEHPQVVARLQEQIREFQPQIPQVWDLKYPVRDPVKQRGGVRRK